MTGSQISIRTRGPRAAGRPPAGVTFTNTRYGGRGVAVARPGPRGAGM